MSYTNIRDDDTVATTLGLSEGTAAAIKFGVVRKELLSGYSRYRSMAARRLRDRDAADDVVQAFALKAFERAPQLRDPRAVCGWLRRLFETTLIDFCRRRTNCRQREVLFEVEIHDRAQDNCAGHASDPARAIAVVLSRLKEEYADVIYRLDLSDQSKEYAAGQLGITINNLTVRSHRARRALRDALDIVPISMQAMAPVKSMPRWPVVAGAIA
jgi:DNA-directed RNA polymerase specialized sigma24 family protein